MSVSHVLFRSSANLPDRPEEGPYEEEYKHNYVLQALYRPWDWAEAVHESEETKDIKWTLRVFSTDTLALAKDTDKEDRERALKASWETTEPGRSEKAKRSR